MMEKPPPAAPLDVLLLLEQIDADTGGEKLRRKLATIAVYGDIVRDHAVTEALRGLPERAPKH